MSEITVRSNGSPQGDAFVAGFNQIVETRREKERLWLLTMKAEVNPALIHPDDGWVDRVSNEVMPCYPQHIREVVLVGDLIVLGDEDKWRVVKCVGVRRGTFGKLYYSFEPTPAEPPSP